MLASREGLISITMMMSGFRIGSSVVDKKTCLPVLSRLLLGKMEGHESEPAAAETAHEPASNDEASREEAASVVSLLGDTQNEDPQGVEGSSAVSEAVETVSRGDVQGNAADQEEIPAPSVSSGHHSEEAHQEQENTSSHNPAPSSAMVNESIQCVISVNTGRKHEGFDILTTERGSPFICACNSFNMISPLLGMNEHSLLALVVVFLEGS